MKRNCLLFFLLPLLILLIVTACAGKGAVDEPVNTAPNTAGAESETGRNASGAAGVKEVKAKEKPGEPGSIDAKESAGAAGVEKEKDEVDGKKKDIPAAKEGSAVKPGAPGTQVQVKTASNSGNRVTLWITKDFGRNFILSKKAALQKDWSVFDVLEANARITTAHGGGFIESINGIKSEPGGLSGKKKDWFYYVNGVFADVGALDYYPRPGDVIWWDYHGWERMPVFPAVIGCYPGPFVHGYRGKAGPAVIVSSEGNRDLAGNLQRALKAEGAAFVSVENLDACLLEKRQGPTIVLGEWSELNQVDWLANLNKAYAKNGTSVHFTGDGVELLDYRGQVARTVKGSAGVIAATGEGSGDGSPLWLVAGTDREGLRRAVDVLVKSPGRISGMYGAVIVNGEVIRLPLQ